VTIDPAKRLADALGLEGLTGTPARIDGPWPGELWALMLDTKSTFVDLVMADTPPTRNALDFIDAPRRLSRFLDHRLFRMVTSPGRGVMKAVNVAAQTFLRTVAKVVGGEVIDDAIAFFRAFEGMEAG